MAPLPQHAPKKKAGQYLYNLEKLPTQSSIDTASTNKHSAWILKNGRKYTEYTHLMQRLEKFQEPLLTVAAAAAH